jgi:hypothetical protein
MAMIRKIAYALAIAGLSWSSVHAQATPRKPSVTNMYCSGIVTSEPVAKDTYIISGPDSVDQLIFSQGDYVFLNKGEAQGVKTGDEFLVVRPVREQVLVPWFVYQDSLLRAMGTTYEDEGRIKVVNAQKDTSTAEVEMSCGYMQRGDVAQPFVERPAPALKASNKLDLFAPSSDKAKAMVVTTSQFGQSAKDGAVVYVNLGSAQGVKVGDYFRVFRYQDGHHETVYQTPHTAYQMLGFGTTPRPYVWSELPRDVLGEGVVLRVGPNAATVLVTISQREIYPGDYVEIE